MKNALNNQVGMLGDMFLQLVANLKQGVIYFIKQACGNDKRAGVYEASIEAAQNFFMYVTIFVTDWAQINHLAKSVLKSSVLKQSLPNSQHKLS